MGFYDIYCFICGNSCHGLLNDTIEDFTKFIEIEKKEDFSLWKNNSKVYSNVIKDLKILYKKTRWMTKCSILTLNNEIIHGTSEVNGNFLFCKKNNCIEHIDKISYSSFVNPGGIFIHTDCWKFIKKNYNIELNASYLPPLNSTNYNKIFNIVYGDIEKYWKQFFDFSNIIIDGKQYLCSSPLKNDKNILQIKKNISQLKIKNEQLKRVGPYVSATFYKDGDIKLGQNKNFWIIKNNKWNEIKEKTIIINLTINIKKIDKNQYLYLSKIKFCSLADTKPIFILSSNNIKKDTYEIKFILIESFNKIFNKNIKIT